MITVCLYGNLREHGKRFKLHVASPAEALRALMVQLPKLRQKIQDGVFQVRFNGKDYSEDEARASFQEASDGILHIVPRVQGSGKFTQIIIGVVLIAIGIIVSPISPVIGSALINVGIAMVIGGVVSLLTTKKSGTDSSQGLDESTRSTSFSNTSNMAAQGRTVPVAYGLCYCGSMVVSQGMESRRVAAKESDRAKVRPSEFMSMVADAAKAKYSRSQNTSATESSAYTGDTAEELVAQQQYTEPAALPWNFEIQRTYFQGVAATAPNGQKYNTDFSNDSVIKQNYTSSFDPSKA